MVIQTTKESGEVDVIADSSKTSTSPPVESALSDKVAKDEQEHHISVDSSSTSTSSSHNSPCSLTKFITYSRDDLIEISKLPASKARPIQLSSGAIDEWVFRSFILYSFINSLNVF